MKRLNPYFLTLLIVFSGIFSSSYGQTSTFNELKQLDQIPKFYQQYAHEYAQDFFQNYMVSHSLNTFNGSQIMFSSAWALEIRAGLPVRFPSNFETRQYTSLYQFKNIRFLDNLPYTKLPGETANNIAGTGAKPLRILYTLNDSAGNPMTHNNNGIDSIQWFLPSLTDLGVNEGVMPHFQYLLRWAPGYAFEFAGTFMIHNTVPSPESSIATNLRTKYYNLYFAHDILYWWQAMHYKGLHVTLSAEFSNYNSRITVDPSKFNFFQNYETGSSKVWTRNYMNTIDFWSRTVRYGLNFGKSFKFGEIWAGGNYLLTMGGISDDGFYNVFYDNAPKDSTNGFRLKRYKGFLFSGISQYQNWTVSAGLSVGQKNIRINAQYNIFNTGFHSASVGVKYVFLDNNKHPWQRNYHEEEYFDPTKKKTVRKTVIMEREELD